MAQANFDGNNRRGRPENPITVTGPEADFAKGLRALRDRAGLSNSEIAKRAHCAPSTVSEALNGRKLPKWPITKAIVVACQGDVTEWEQRWNALQRR
jgi:transcriptional regulator with XRE-family HTH domain